MKSFIYWLFDNLFSEPLNSRICWAGIALAAAYFVFQFIRMAL